MIFSTIVSFLSVTVLARLLTPRDYGLMGIVMLVIGFGMAYSDSGISAALIHFQTISKEQLSTLYWFCVGVGGILYAAIFLVSPLLSLAFQEPEIVPLIQITGISFLIFSFGHQFQTLLQKEMAFRSLALIEILTSTISNLITILLAMLGFGVMALVLGYLTGSAIKTVLVIVAGWRIWNPMRMFNVSEVKHLLSFGGYQVGERSINFFFGQIDKVIVGIFLGTTSLGYYNIAWNLIFQPIQAINPVFTKVYFPYFSKMQHDAKMLKETYFDLIKIITFITFPFLLIMMVVAPELVPLLYGPQWIPSIILVQVLGISGLLTCLGNPIGSLLLSKGYARRGFIWNIIASVFIGVGMYASVMFGLVGIAWSKGLVKLVMVPLGYLYLIKKCLGPCLRGYFRQFIPFLLFSCAGALVALFFVHPTPLVQLLGQGLLGFGIYLVLVVIFDRRFLNQFITRYLKPRGWRTGA